MIAYRLTAWRDDHETTYTVKVKKRMAWYSTPRHYGRRELNNLRVAHPNGWEAFYGCYHLFCQVTMELPIFARGWLVRVKSRKVYPLTHADLASETLLSVETVEAALEAPSARGVEWIERAEFEPNSVDDLKTDEELPLLREGAETLSDSCSSAQICTNLKESENTLSDTTRPDSTVPYPTGDHPTSDPVHSVQRSAISDTGTGGTGVLASPIGMDRIGSGDSGWRMSTKQVLKAEARVRNIMEQLAQACRDSPVEVAIAWRHRIEDGCKKNGYDTGPQQHALDAIADRIRQPGVMTRILWRASFALWAAHDIAIWLKRDHRGQFWPLFQARIEKAFAMEQQEAARAPATAAGGCA